MRRHENSDEQWNKIAHLLPGRPGDGGRVAKDNRLFVNAVFWIVQTGVAWRDLPERFRTWNSVFQRHNRWTAKGVLKRVLDALGGDADLETLMLDSTVVRAHQHAAGAKGGKARRLSDARARDSAQRSTSRLPSIRIALQTSCRRTRYPRASPPILAPNLAFLACSRTAQLSSRITIDVEREEGGWDRHYGSYRLAGQLSDPDSRPPLGDREFEEAKRCKTASSNEP